MDFINISSEVPCSDLKLIERLREASNTTIFPKPSLIGSMPTQRGVYEEVKYSSSAVYQKYINFNNLVLEPETGIKGFRLVWFRDDTIGLSMILHKERVTDLCRYFRIHGFKDFCGENDSDSDFLLFTGWTNVCIVLAILGRYNTIQWKCERTLTESISCPVFDSFVKVIYSGISLINEQNTSSLVIVAPRDILIKKKEEDVISTQTDNDIKRIAWQAEYMKAKEKQSLCQHEFYRMNESGFSWCYKCTHCDVIKHGTFDFLSTHKVIAHV